MRTWALVGWSNGGGTMFPSCMTSSVRASSYRRRADAVSTPSVRRSCKVFYFAKMHELDPKVMANQIKAYDRAIAVLALGPLPSRALPLRCVSRKKRGRTRSAFAGELACASACACTISLHFPQETVSLFAEFALEVEATPQGSSHANIRCADTRIGTDWGTPADADFVLGSLSAWLGAGVGSGLVIFLLATALVECFRWYSSCISLTYHAPPTL